MWSVYVIRCNDGTLYTGVTTDIKRRLAEHNSGTGAKYTRSRTPVELVASSNVASRSDALKLEARTKKLPKDRKVSFINEQRADTQVSPHKAFGELWDSEG